MEEELIQIMNVPSFQQLAHQMEISVDTACSIRSHVSSTSAVLSLSLATRTSLFS